MQLQLGRPQDDLEKVAPFWHWVGTAPLMRKSGLVDLIDRREFEPVETRC